MSEMTWEPRNRQNSDFKPEVKAIGRERNNCVMQSI